MGKMMLLGNDGDITLSWKQDNDFQMKKLISKYIEEGYTFYVVKSLFGFQYCERKVNDVNEIKQKILIKDDDFKPLFEDIEVELVKTKKSDKEFDVICASKDPEEIVKSETVAVKTPVGG